MTAIVPLPPSVAGYPPPGQKLQHDDSAAVWLQPTERDSSHDSMVSSTSNLPSSAAQESDAASVLLYQSSNSGKDPRLWNVQEVTGFMYSIGCSNYADAFVKEVCLSCSHIREVKLDVYGKLQTAKIKLLSSVFSSLYSSIKIFVFAVNSKRHFSIFV